MLARAQLLVLVSWVMVSSAHALEPKAIVPAMQAVQAGSAIVAWAPDYRSVLGYDGDGVRKWRVATGDQGGTRELELIGANVLVYAGQEAILVAPDSGKVLGRRKGITWGAKGAGCSVREQDGACALSCGCTFEVVACDTLATLGKPIVTTPEPGTPTCHAFESEIVGRSQDLVIMTVPSQASRTSRVVPVVRGYDVKSGAVVWESSLFARLQSVQSGVTPEMCFAGTDSKIAGFDCGNGALIWELALDGKSMPQVDRIGAGLLVADGPYVSLLDARTGAPRWRVARAGLALMADMRPRERTGNWDEARIFGDDGTILGEVKLPAGIATAPRRFGDGWVALGKSNIAAFDGRGKSLGGLGTSQVWFGLKVGTRKLLGWDGNALTVVHAPAKKASVVIDEPSEVVAFEGPIGDGRLVTMLRPNLAWDAKDPATFGELRFYGIAP